MGKRAQTMSFDLVMGIIVFLLSLSIFFHSLSGIIGEKKSLSAESSLLSHSLSLIQDQYAFLKDYHIDPGKLALFQDLDYNASRSILLAPLKTNPEDFDYCLFFTNRSQILNIDGKSGIGFQGISLAESLNCSDANVASVEVHGRCSIDYPRSADVRKPVVRNGRIEIMHILICSREHYE